MTNKYDDAARILRGLKDRLDDSEEERSQVGGVNVVRSLIDTSRSTDEWSYPEYALDVQSGRVETGLTPSELGVGGSESRTIAAFIRPEAYNHGGAWEFGSHGSGTNDGFSLRTRGEEHQWRAVLGTDEDISFSTVAGKSEVVHIGLVNDDGTTRVYVNGTEVESKAQVSGLDTADDVPLTLGEFDNVDFKGALDQVVVYGRALDSSEMDDLADGYTPPRGLLAEWRFDEKGASVVKDSSGPAAESLHFGGQSLEFDTDEHVECSRQVVWAPGTVSTWFIPRTLDGTEQHLVSDYNNAGMFIRVNTSDEIEAGVEDDSGTVTATVEADPVVGRVYHAAMTFADGGTLRAFKNGEEVDSTAMGTYQPSGEDLRLGVDPGETHYLDGILDGVRYYQFDIDAWEIESLYDGAPSSVSRHLDAYYPFLGGNMPARDMTTQQAIDFEDTGGMDVGTPTEVKITDAVTLDLFVYPRSLSQDGKIAGRDGYDLSLTAAGNLEWALDDGTSTSVLQVDMSGYDANQWFHIVAAWDGTTDANGQTVTVEPLDATKDTYSQASSVSTLEDAGDFTLGYFDGKASKVRLYDDDVAAFWPCDHITGTTVRELIHDNDGTLTGDATFDSVGGTGDDSLNAQGTLVNGPTLQQPIGEYRATTHGGVEWVAPLKWLQDVWVWDRSRYDRSLWGE